MPKHHITDPADPLYLPSDNAVTLPHNSATVARLVADLNYERVHGRFSTRERDRRAAIAARKQSEDVLPEPTGVALLDPLTNKAVMPDGSRATLLGAMKAALLPTDAAEMGIEAVRAYAATARAAGNLSREIEQALFAAELIALPEAEGRRSFALDIATAYCGTWSLDRAAAFLAGLPREDGTEELIECTPRRSLRDRVLARSQELRAEGRSAADQATGRALAYALDVNDQTGMDLAEALVACGINPKAI